LHKGSAAIVGLSFGEGPETNQHLADYVLWIQRQNRFFYKRMFLILQKEIADLLPQEVDKASVGGKEYLNTYQVLKRVKQEAARRNIADIILVAHQALRPRAKRTARKLGFIVLPCSPKFKFPWPRHDKQWWVRGPIQWWLREIFVAWPGFKINGWI
jgi:hypothetical protein